MILYSKENLIELSYREDDGHVHKILLREVGSTRMIVCFQCHLIAKDLFPEDINSFRFDTVNMQD